MSTKSITMEEIGNLPPGLTCGQKLQHAPVAQSQEDLLGDDSLCSREGLRRDMAKRKSSLTMKEHSFLESLVIHGNDIEVELARKCLNDATLFFTPSTDEEEKKEGRDNQDNDGFGDSITIGRETYVGMEGEAPAEPPISSLAALSSSGSSKATRRSSIKALQYLESRKNNEIHGRIWKAHENGLAVTAAGSRRSFMRRSNSLGGPLRARNVTRSNSILSATTQELVEHGGPTHREGEDEIFRENSSNGIRSSLFFPKRPPRHSRSVTHEGTTRTASPNIPKSIIRPPDIPPPMGMGSKTRSDSSRKSVTFGDESETPRRGNIRRPSPPRSSKRLSRQISDLSVATDGTESHVFSSDSTIESFPAIRHGRPLRSDSITSIPSLHHGRPIRSDSISSIPSIHHAHPVRSESLAAILDGPETKDDEETKDPAWSSPMTDPAAMQESKFDSDRRRPILLRSASRNVYQGEGIEISEWTEEEAQNISKARLYSSMLSMGDDSVRTSSSLDETGNRDGIFRDIRRSLSDDELASYFLGQTKDLLGDSEATIRVSRTDPDLEEDVMSWDMNSFEEGDRPDAWKVLKDEYAVGYGAFGTLPFRILGTHADDERAKPHVLSPPLMESLQQFFPYVVSEDNFWLKYSLVRDGASMHTLLSYIRGARYTILALETADGEVFGSFTSQPWRKSWNYFGTGESFLWRMRQSRNSQCHSIIDQAHLESELDVYPWTGENNCVQLCTHDKIAVGGGTVASEKKDETHPDDETFSYGFGLAIERELLHGTSSHCATFSSPPLSLSHQDGSPFEIVNIEMWTMTPCETLEDAEKLELGLLFLAQ